ncbi:MAG: hypothetical protein J0M26_04915 [Planctomycetes bacterium]|nr:hypothetical protein [Planctomycetota bacterium]
MSIDKEMLLAKCDFFVEAQLWPTHRTLDFQGWLQNFEEDEMETAVLLLSHFIYYSNELTQQLFRYAISKLVSQVCDFSMPSAQAQWDEFTKNVLVTHVTGEDPNPSDSGYHFSRMSRQIVGVEPTQIVTNEEAIERLSFGDSRAVIFVDDFVGSGKQFCETWDRTHGFGNPARHESFSTVTENAQVDVATFYCPVICTWKGNAAIKRRAPRVNVLAAHDIDESYSVFSEACRFWPAEYVQKIESDIRKASKRAGIGRDWRGFNDLGLTIAFEHCIPDATIPLFWHESRNWVPLKKRS